MRRVLLVSGVLCGCLGPVQEGLTYIPAPPPAGGSFFDAGCGTFVSIGNGCGPNEPGDPQHLVTYDCFQKPTCDLEAMNRQSQSPAEPFDGIDAPTPELKEAANLIVGQWQGTQMTEWDGTHAVMLTFFANGRYSGTSIGEYSRLFFYGESCAYHRKSWRLESGTSSLARGHIQNTQDLVPMCMNDELRDIQVDATSLRFELWRRDGQGPVVFDLRRTQVMQ